MVRSRPSTARRLLPGIATATLLLGATLPGLVGSGQCADAGGGGGHAELGAIDLQRFGDWLAELRADARARGISDETLDRALADVQPIGRVIELDRDQPEFKLSFADYLTRVAPQSRVEKGRRLLRENRELLAKLYDRYGVQPRFLVALWGVETDFGRTLGSFELIPALATLAFDGRRGSYFRGELIEALRILDAGHADPDDFKGSWAGALGQCQFMPSTFMRHAVDFDGDGRCDIWHSRSDALASAANYLASMGWSGDRIWGRPVQLPAGFDPAQAGLKVRKRLSEWQALGVRRAGGGDLPKAPDLTASVILPAGAGGPAYVVYDNFSALMSWNRSIHFATTVGILADRIGRRGG